MKQTKVIQKIEKWLKNHFSNPRRSLFRQLLLWLWVLPIGGIAIAAAAVIFIDSNVGIDFSKRGFDTFVDLYQFPLGVLAILVPVVALIASNHRSLQSAAQIELSAAQSNFSNYFQHRSEFTKYLNLADPGNKIFVNPNLVYDWAYPYARDGLFLTNPQLSIVEWDIRALLEPLQNTGGLSNDKRDEINNLLVRLLPERGCTTNPVAPSPNSDSEWTSRSDDYFMRLAPAVDALIHLSLFDSSTAESFEFINESLQKCAPRFQSEIEKHRERKRKRL